MSQPSGALLRYPGRPASARGRPSAAEQRPASSRPRPAIEAQEAGLPELCSEWEPRKRPAGLPFTEARAAPTAQTPSSSTSTREPSPEVVPWTRLSPSISPPWSPRPGTEGSLPRVAALCRVVGPPRSLAPPGATTLQPRPRTAGHRAPVAPLAEGAEAMEVGPPHLQSPPSTAPSPAALAKREPPGNRILAGVAALAMGRSSITQLADDAVPGFSEEPRAAARRPHHAERAAARSQESGVGKAPWDFGADYALGRGLHCGMVDPIGLLLDDMTELLTSGTDSEVRSNGREIQSTARGGCPSPGEWLVEPCSEDEDDLRGRRAGGRNWRGIDRPADLIGPSPPASPLVHSVESGRGIELVCEPGLGTQYSRFAESWRGSPLQSPVRRHLRAALVAGKEDAKDDSAEEDNALELEQGHRWPCGCPPGSGCMHWPSGRGHGAGDLPPLRGAVGGRFEALGLFLAPPPPAEAGNPAWLRPSRQERAECAPDGCAGAQA
mmetsp:Transcript_24546/g.53539  ORF Transcript_24546/g.53539 Transcript_24546/m.53539 type:complete len:495 (-) Transcript_24546:59-1543(-)